MHTIETTMISFIQDKPIADNSGMVNAKEYAAEFGVKNCVGPIYCVKDCIQF
jgi:hypothetical protein